MILKNASKKTILAKNAKWCKGWLDKLFGLHLAGNPQSLIFQTRFGIHTIFLSRSIDVLILDQNLKVVKIEVDLLPNKFFFWNPIYDLCLELPGGSIVKSKTQVGDRLSF